MSKSEQEHVRKRLGKWSNNEVPHSGWACINVQDLGEASEKCEMCEAHEVRYVHYMRHKDYPTSLAVGCVCAGHMEGDLDAAMARDKEMQKQARRRQQWLKKHWGPSANGNPYHRNKEGYLVILYDKGTHWEGRIRHEPKKIDIYSKQKYATCDKAKLAAFDSIQILISKDSDQK